MRNTFVVVEYKGESDERDSIIEAIAKKKGGRESGAGFYFATKIRDLTFTFPDEKKAAAFIKAVKAKKLEAKPQLLYVG